MCAFTHYSNKYIHREFNSIIMTVIFSHTQNNHSDNGIKYQQHFKIQITIQQYSITHHGANKKNVCAFWLTHLTLHVVFLDVIEKHWGWVGHGMFFQFSFFFLL